MRRFRTGSVVLDKRSKVWNFYWWEGGKRKSKRLGDTVQFPTKQSAWKAAKPLRDAIEGSGPHKAVVTVKELIAQYRQEKMPKRFSTRYGYEAWISNHVVPRWGECEITDVKARPVELWLKELTLAPKSRAHIRGVLSILWDFAMWAGHIPVERNPMALVTVKEVTKRQRKPRTLTVEEFQKFVQQLKEPFRTIALVCVCFGLRISECLALRWSDVDWLNGSLHIQRGIVRQNVDDVKTDESEQHMAIDSGMLELLKTWKQSSQFTAEDDWIFASPSKLGRLPWSYPRVWVAFQDAGADAGIGKLGTHTMRYSYRAWLDLLGTKLVVQKKLMRHADIRTTMNVYGDVVTPEMSQAHSKVVGLALNGRETAGKPS
jgi:integrase